MRGNVVYLQCQYIVSNIIRIFNPASDLCFSNIVRITVAKIRILFQCAKFQTKH